MMTVVAIRDGILAADRRIVAGNTCLRQSMRKIYRHGSQCYAFVGRQVNLSAFQDHIANIGHLDLAEIRKFRLPEEGYILYFAPDYIIEFSGEGYNLIDYGEFYAWGSGSDIALGAMFAGATAAEAVEIAAKVDVLCGDGVDELEI